MQVFIFSLYKIYCTRCKIYRSKLHIISLVYFIFELKLEDILHSL